VVFEGGSRLERIEESSFSINGLKLILIPSSVIVLGKSSFHVRMSLEQIVFESSSRLERIDRSVFLASPVNFELASEEERRTKSQELHENQSFDETRGQSRTKLGNGNCDTNSHIHVTIKATRVAYFHQIITHREKDCIRCSRASAILYHDLIALELMGTMYFLCVC
jgi:hypothetical protein